MRSYFILLFIFFGISCGENNQKDATDSPKAIDSAAKHPDGMINGSVISTDTAAMTPTDTLK